MSTDDGYSVAKRYAKISQHAKDLGRHLHDPL